MKKRRGKKYLKEQISRMIQVPKDYSIWWSYSSRDKI
jgi:hypothetical protein